MMEPAIGKKYVSTPFGDIAFLETGTSAKPPLLFVHGIPTSGHLWRHVVRFLQDDFHCFAPDLLGLGDTRMDPADGPCDMETQAEMLLAFMDALGHESFGLVCHDQGGAAAQIVAARLPERLRCLVITDAVCYDNWPVPVITWMQELARLPYFTDWAGRTGLIEWIEAKTPLSAFRRGLYRGDRLDPATLAEYLRPLRGDSTRRAQFRRFLMAGHSRYTELAVEGMKAFDKPTLVLWAADDKYLSPSWGKKLSEDVPGVCRFELIPFCGHFWQEERPAEFASHIRSFCREHLRSEVPDDKKPAKPAKPAKRKRRKAPVVAEVSEASHA